jgi:hypothetical protein
MLNKVLDEIVTFLNGAGFNDAFIKYITDAETLAEVNVEAEFPAKKVESKFVILVMKVLIILS